MKAKDLIQNMHDRSQAQIVWVTGQCHDCGAQVQLRSCIISASGQFEISGGTLYVVDNRAYMKCDACFEMKNELTNFHHVECYSRIVGYLRPIEQWNPGKLEEFKERVVFRG